MGLTFKERLRATLCRAAERGSYGGFAGLSALPITTADMNPFDYLTILVSIVLGLAMTNVLTRLAAIVSARERVDFYWPPVAWAIWVFFICVQHWWAAWSTHEMRAWTFLAFFTGLLDPIILFFLSALVLPDRDEAGPIDLGAWYYRNRAWFFGTLALLPIASIVDELVRTARIASMLNLAFLIAFDVVVVFALLLPSRRAQEWITAQALILTVVYVAMLFLPLPV
jgi:hypothetical protein